MRNPKNILKHELIGLDAKVVKSSNKYQEGLHGTIINETRDTVVLETNSDDKRLEKQSITLQLDLNSEVVDIEGSYLVGRPEDRIKNKVSKW